MPEVFLFAGPSLTGRADALARSRGIHVLPPASRNDVARLAQNRSPGILVLADGRFHDAMAVGHAELREALKLGWRVWGLSSMGAIRAYELRFLGMRGWGRVYEMFERFEDFQDDEVALLHGARAPYRVASEPLVHLRVAAAYLVRRQFISRRVASQTIRDLKGLWYGDRTLELFQRLLLRCAGRPQHAAIRRALADFDRFRVKQKDLAAFLAARSLWCVHGTSPA
jgi:hypothetical protein